MRKFHLAELAFTDDQIQLTVIREAVMPDDSLISKVETYCVASGSLSPTVVECLNDFVERVIHDYNQGLASLPAMVAEDPVDDDNDSIGVRQ